MTLPELKKQYKRKERELIKQALISSNSITEAAEKLGVKRTTLSEKLKRMRGIYKYLKRY